MKYTPVARSLKLAARWRDIYFFWAARSRRQTGFTLIETLVAISLITVSIVGPMALASQSLSVAHYARDQITAYNLAQEGIEAVRAIRDGNVLADALLSANASLLNGIPTGGTPFTIDARYTVASDAIQTCSTVPCPPLQTDGTLYGYAVGDRSNQTRDASWVNTTFTRTMTATYVGPASQNSGQDVIRVTATVTWLTPNGASRTFAISENMYRWVSDGSAAQ